MALGVQVTFDAADPRRLAEFWAIALDYELQPPPQGYGSWEQFADAVGLPRESWDSKVAILDPARTGPRLLFQRVPERKAAKNRVHLDIRASSPHEHTERGWQQVLARADVLLAAGARLVRELDDATDRCLVMSDPEGNEFCVQ